MEETTTAQNTADVPEGKAMDYKNLQTYLPRKVKGYTAEGDPEGQKMDMQAYSFSQAQQEYSKGEDGLSISLVDYAMAAPLLQSQTAAWNFSYENDEERASSTTIYNGEMKGWEVYDKKDKEANLFIVISDRFYVNITAENQADTELVKDIAEALNLKKLAK